MSRWKVRFTPVTLTIASGLAVASGSLGLTPAGSASAASSAPAAQSAAAAIPATTINVNGDGGDKAYQGTGAILGGGGNARYLMDYPSAQRNQILDYLFKPGYGASLQILKLEIGGGTNSTDGSEASIEPASGHINCNAGYEFSIAQAAVQRNPNIILYGLQWTAPAWVTGTDASDKPAAAAVCERTRATGRGSTDWLPGAMRTGDRPCPGSRLQRSAAGGLP